MKSATRAIEVLELLASRPVAPRAGTIARMCGIPRSTTYQLLRLLEDEGLVSRDERGRYSPGLRLAALGASLRPIEELRLAARPVLFTLRDRTGESANLVVRDGAYAIYLDQVESRRPLPHAGWVGRRIPVASTATGRALSDAGPQWGQDAVEVGVTAVACGVAATGEYRAAISVTGPSLRLRGPDLQRAESLVVAASRDVSQRLLTLVP